MSKRLCFLSSVVLALVLASSVSAQDDVTYWTDGGGDHVWCNPSNWDSGLPESNPNLASWETRGVDAIINIEDITDAVLIGPACNAGAAWVGVGASVNTGPGVGLNMTGGTFTLMEIELGQCDGGFGWMTMSGGTIDFYDYSYLAIGSNGGEGRLDMTGGEINVLGETWVGSPALQWAGTLRLPKNEGRCEGNDGVGHLQLDGGVIRVRILQMSENGTMDITGGALIITGRDSPEVQSWYGDLWDEVISEVNDGDLTAYGGSGIVGIEYVDNPDPNEPNEIWVVGRIDAATAWNPRPQNGTVDILKDVVLEWSAGDYVQTTNGHELYFGTSFGEVNSRSVTPVVLSSTTYDAGANEALELGEVYYWAVDEVNGTTTWAGPVWSFAMDRGVAKNPNPAHGADEVPKVATLSWTAGVEAATTGGHDVYFGTSSTEVNDADTSSGEFEGNQDGNSWSTSNYASSLELIRTYYWRIDEINGSNLWKGDVWRFEVEGRAKNPSPSDGAVDVPFLGLELSWEAGVDALSHDVYFGSSSAEVSDANTNSPEFENNQVASDVNYAIPRELLVGGSYYWRIDENSSSITAKGHVWGFTVGEFLRVDDFESYANNYDLYEVWEDGIDNQSGAEIFLEWDVNVVRDPSHNPSALYVEYDNKAYDDVGSYFDAQDMSELEIGSDWTVGGVKALQLWMRGDPCAVLGKQGKETLWAEGWPWVEIEDTSSNSGYVLYPAEDITDILGPYWHEWNIDLAIFDACGVVLTAIDRLTIGIGGPKAGQDKQGASYLNKMWFDDIRLYPPRCRPELSQAVGDFTGDCSVMYEDLDVMGTDWLLTDGNTPTENQPATLSGFPDETSHWVTGHIGGAVEVNEGYNIDVNDPRLYGLASMSITAWVKQPVDNEWVGIVCSREYPCGGTGEATELGIYGSDWGGPDGLGYDWSCLSGAWKWDADLDVPDGTWTFIAMSVDPNGCTLYMRPDGETLQTGKRNWIDHPAQQSFAESFMIGRSGEESGYFVGAIDDVRIYTYALDFNDVNNLAYETAEPSPPPVYHYKFDEETGYTAADSGTTTEVYAAVPSVANMTDPEPKLQRSVNFADYAVLADNWMSQDYWP